MAKVYIERLYTLVFFLLKNNYSVPIIDFVLIAKEDGKHWNFNGFKCESAGNGRKTETSNFISKITEI